MSYDLHIRVLVIYISFGSWEGASPEAFGYNLRPRILGLIRHDFICPFICQNENISYNKVEFFHHNLKVKIEIHS